MASLPPVNSRINARVDNRPQTQFDKSQQAGLTSNLKPTIHLDAQKALLSEITNKLNQQFGLQGSQKLQYLQPEDYGPQAVADRILGFVEGHINAKAKGGASDDELNDLLSQARQGIDKGFSEAEDILKGLDMLNGKVKQDINDTYNLLQDGLTNFEKELFEDVATADNARDTHSTQSAELASSQSQQRRFSLEVTTRDGDVIQIQASASQSSQSAMSLGSQGNQSSVSAVSSKSSSFELNFSIQGDLDQQEKQSLAHLMSQLNDVADEFFNGDLQQAFEQAKSLKYNDNEIAEFAFKAHRRETSAVAARYQQDQAPSNNPFKQLGDAFDQFEQVYSAPNMQELFENPVAVATQVLEKMVESQQQTQELLAEAREKLDKVFEFFTEVMPEIYQQGKHQTA